MKNRHKLLLTALTIGVAGALAGVGVFSAFSSTTSNPGNSFTAGTVAIGDNDSGSALYNVSNQKPGVTTEKCVKVTYTGSLDADVKLYSGAVGAGGQYVDLNIASGTGSNSSCSDFTVDASGATVYNGTVKAFADAHSGWSNGLADNPLAATKWAQNATVTYRFRVSVQDSDSAQGATTGSHDITWEARNQ